MADLYLTTNAGYGATDILLRTSTLTTETTTPAGGNLRRHLGKSTGPDRQVQRFINFRWRFTATVGGETYAMPSRIASPNLNPAVAFIHGSTTMTAGGLKVTGRLAATTRVNPPTARMWPDDEDDLLVLLL